MTDLNLIASAPQTHSADVLDPFEIIDDMVDLRIQMAQLEQQIRELQPLFFAACFRLNQAKIDRSRAIISRKLTPAQWTYTAEILDQEVVGVFSFSPWLSGHVWHGHVERQGKK